MASTTESVQLISTHDNRTATFSQPEMIRTAPIPLGPGSSQSPWSGLNDIWTKPGGHQGGRHNIGTRNTPLEKSEKMVESDTTFRPVSPNHYDRLSRLRIPTANSASAPREQRSLATTTSSSRHLPMPLPPATSAVVRVSAPHTAPHRARKQELPVSTAGQPMSILSNAGLLSGSAPDVEIPSNSSGYAHRHSGQSAFRTLDIEGVNEFVPSLQQTHVDPRAFDNSFAYEHVPQLHMLETNRARNPMYFSDQNPVSTRHYDPPALDQSLGQLARNPRYTSGISRNVIEPNNRISSSLDDEYDFENVRATNMQFGNISMPRFPGEQEEFGTEHRHMDVRGRVEALLEHDQCNDLKMFSPVWSNGMASSQAYEHQYYAHTNRNAFFVNKETSSHTTHDIRNGMYTPAFTPPSAPESQRSASGSGPSTNASTQVTDTKIRAYESSQTRSQGRTGMYPGYLPQVSQGYCQGYQQQTGSYSDAYAANRMVNAMGPTSQEICEQREDPEKPISPFLKEFKASCKTKRYELKDVYGYIVEFSGDQHGSRFIQGKLETANSDEKEQVFVEIQENALQLMTDIFGNYVIQKLFEHGTQAQKKVLANQMKGRVLYLTTQVYGCRVVQKALEHVLTDQQAIMVRELEGHILPIVENQNGNHVIQKAIERVPGEHIHFIIDALKGQTIRLAKHNYGCRVVQRMLEYGQPSVKRSILAELHTSVSSLIADTFGNYVVQHIIRHGEPADRARVVSLVQQQLLFYSKHKFASNVVEAAIESSEENQRQEILRGLTGPDHDGHTPVYNLIRDQYGNYVIQKVLQRLTGSAKDDLIRELRHSIIALRRVSNGKQVAAIEKAISEATNGYSQHSPSRVSHHGGHTAHHVVPTEFYHARTHFHGQPAGYPRMSLNSVRS